jgi:hypothetical protein
MNFIENLSDNYIILLYYIIIYLPGNLYNATSLQLISNSDVKFGKLAHRHIVYNGHSYNTSRFVYNKFRLSNFQLIVNLNVYIIDINAIVKLNFR